MRNSDERDQHGRGMFVSKSNMLGNIARGDTHILLRSFLLTLLRGYKSPSFAPSAHLTALALLLLLNFPVT